MGVQLVEVVAVRHLCMCACLSGRLCTAEREGLHVRDSIGLCGRSERVSVNHGACDGAVGAGRIQDMALLPPGRLRLERHRRGS